jgi:hypothetical protein
VDRLIYLSMAGAKATLQRQDTLANNLANASTTGFRAEMQAFRAVPVRGDGASTRVYALESTVGADMRSPGPVQSTGRALDVAMLGNAWLAVQSLDGTEAYTRRVAAARPRGPARHPAGCRCWATAARSRCRPMPRWRSPPTAASPPRWATRAAAGRPPEAGDARDTAAARHRRPVPRARWRPHRRPHGAGAGGALEGSNVSPWRP